MNHRTPRLIEALEPRIVLAGADPLVAMLAKLGEFAGQKTTSFAAQPDPPAYTLLTAKADDVVFAVYQLTMTPDFDEASEITGLVKTALEARLPKTGTALKVRADKDKLAPRILAAALIGSGLTAAADVEMIAEAIAKVNAGDTKTQLTVAGKEAVIGQALKSTTGGAPAVGAALATLAIDLSRAAAGISPDVKLQSFTIATIKIIGTATGQVKEFIDGVLDALAADANASFPTARDTFALKVAEGVAKVPAAAGEVVGGRAQDIGVDSHDAKITSITQGAIKDTKLAKAIADVVCSAMPELVNTTPELFTTALVGASGLNTKATAVNCGSVAAGVIANLTPAQVTGGKVVTVIDASLSVRNGLTKAELSTYTGAASSATGDLAGEVVTKASLFADGVAPNDRTVRNNIGIAALKAIATTTPDAGKVIAQKLIAAGSGLFTTDQQKTDLAKALAKGVSTSGPTAGAAVAGVGTTLNLSAPTSDGLATFIAAVIPSATKATINIAEKVAALSQVTDYAGFSAKVVQTTGFSVNNAASVAAGVAVTASTLSSSQSPGEIAVAVANGDMAHPGTAALKKKTATIAGAVALAVDVERIADIGAKVGALYQKAIPLDANLPKFSAIGTLATSLAKAINTKPLVTAANRVDELGELAAELTRATIIGLGETDPKLASTIASVGTAVMKGLSSALLINAGGFAADLKDSARDLAGAIAQTIAYIGSITPAVISDGNVDTLLKDTSVLATALAKAAKQFAPEVNGIVSTANPLGGAFGEVRLAKINNNSFHLVSGSEALGAGEIPLDGTSPTFGKYEVGSLIDPQAAPVSFP